MNFNRMTALAVAMIACVSLQLGSSGDARAQPLPVDTVAQQGIPAGYNFAPQTPSGFITIGNNVWVGDESQGFRHYLPVDPTNPTPLDSGQYQFDTNTMWSLGGGTDCVPWCSVGQFAKFSDTIAFVASWQHAKGQPGSVGGGGVWMIQIQPQQFFNVSSSPFGGLSPVAAFAGLGGNLPTSVALGPDGKLYFGNLKNGDIKRITNPSVINPSSSNQTVESVGGALNGRPILSMAFLGSDLYIGTDQSLELVRNVTACFGNSGGCGNAVLVRDGFAGVSHPGVAADPLRGFVYFDVNSTGSVYRLTPADGRIVQVASGFAFVAAHTNTLALDPDGNLWIGDNPAPEGTRNSGRLSRVTATNLGLLQ